MIPIEKGKPRADETRSNERLVKRPKNLELMKHGVTKVLESTGAEKEENPTCHGIL